MKRKTYTIDELNAYKTAYDKPIVRQDIITIMSKPFIFTFLFAYIVYFNWWISLIYAGIAAFYAYRVLLPGQIKRVYVEKSFIERHNMINHITQILTNEEETVLSALAQVTDGANGKFKEDLLKLRLQLSGANDSQILRAFKEFEDAYQEDKIFQMYVNQLTTTMIEGRTNVDTLKNLKSYHNTLKKMQDGFFAEKLHLHRKLLGMIQGGAILIGAIIVGLGWQQFIDQYAHTLIGIVFSTVYMFAIGIAIHRHNLLMQDDKVMEVRV
ncbi:TPA_asm: hypothetical protein GZK45_15095 [Listeria innocua]|nr:hypothetical protein [Listeria innocua]